MGFGVCVSYIHDARIARDVQDPSRLFPVDDNAPAARRTDDIVQSSVCADHLYWRIARRRIVISIELHHPICVANEDEAAYVLIDELDEGDGGAFQIAVVEGRELCALRPVKDAVAIVVSTGS